MPSGERPLRRGVKGNRRGARTHAQTKAAFSLPWLSMGSTTGLFTLMPRLASFWSASGCGGVYRCHGHLKLRRVAKVCAMSRHWFRSASALSLARSAASARAVSAASAARKAGVSSACAGSGASGAFFCACTVCALHASKSFGLMCQRLRLSLMAFNRWLFIARRIVQRDTFASCAACSGVKVWRCGSVRAVVIRAGLPARGRGPDGLRLVAPSLPRNGRAVQLPLICDGIGLRLGFRRVRACHKSRYGGKV